MTAVGVKRGPVHRLAWTGFGVAILALLLAWYGSLHAEKHISGSPLREARGAANVIAEPGPWYERLWDRAEVTIFGERFDQKVLALTERSKIARYSLQIVAYVLPFALGLAAALVGGTAMTVIEKSHGQYSGNFQWVFGILIGGFTAVIAGCMIAIFYLWPHMPSLYTQ